MTNIARTVSDTVTSLFAKLSFLLEADQASRGRYMDKGGITPEEDHEDLTTSWKIEGRSENVVKMK